MRRSSGIRSQGFTLIELSIVLIIITLLIGGMLMPLSSQRNIKDVADTQKTLNDIREALLGYAAIHKSLPCPATDNTSDAKANPANANYGMEDATYCNKEGLLPWRTLGVSERDAWGSPRSAQSAPFTGYWRYRVDSNFASGATIAVGTTTAVTLSVSNATSKLSNDGDVVAVIYSTGANRAKDGANNDADATTYQTGEVSGNPVFDDQLIWISRPMLIGRLIAAGVF